MTLDLDCHYKTQINVYRQEMTSQDLRPIQIYRCSTTLLLSPLPQVHIALIKTTPNARVPCSHLLCFIYFVGRWKHKLLLSCVLLECKLFSMAEVWHGGRVCVCVCVCRQDCIPWPEFSFSVQSLIKTLYPDTCFQRHYMTHLNVNKSLAH